MKKLFILCLTVGIMFSCDRAPEEKKETEVTKETKPQDDKAYAIGYDIGVNLGETGMDVDVDSMVKGMRDGFKGECSMDDETLMKAQNEFRQEASQKMQEKQAKAAAENVGSAKAFMDENSKKDGVKTTASGLQYSVMTMGEGDKPAETSKVKVHYAGTLVDGSEFDSSYKRNQPAEFPLNGVIKGWTEGLQLMPVGSKFKFFIPPELGYGARGGGGKIPPNSALIFEVELLEILSK